MVKAGRKSVLRKKKGDVKNVGAYRALAKVIGSCVGEAGYTARRKE